MTLKKKARKAVKAKVRDIIVRGVGNPGGGLGEADQHDTGRVGDLL